MRKIALRLLKYLYVGLIAVLPVYAIANNYQATSGSGITFGSIVVSAVNYAQFMLCDLTTPTQCAAVSAAGAVKVDGSAVTQPVSAASLPLPTGAATSANQSSQITQETATAGVLGTTTDTAAANGAATATLNAVAKGILTAAQAQIPAGTNIIGKVGVDQTTPGTTNNVTVGPVNSSPTNFSATTSGTPSTATTLLAASSTHQKIVIKVEGATAVCFSQFGTAVIGATGTWCLKGASTANAGDGGSYVTPGGMTEPGAISMISTGTSILVTGWWQ
jgi:hypothetical protein